MRHILILISITSLMIVTSCSKENESVQVKAPVNMTSGHTLPQHEVTVKEVIQTASYSYLKVNENGEDYWVAVSKQDAQVGDNLIFSQSMEMHDFHSKTLDRTFDSILFVDRAQNRTHPNQMNIARSHGTSQASTPINVETYKDGITLAQLFENPKNYVGKAVAIRGKVTKINNHIMGRNWVHLQDGTQAKGKIDLTVTTQANIEKGDVVILKGNIVMNKDFGSGYFYEILMEEAKVIN